MRTVTSSPWTPDDRALLLGLTAHRDSLCPKCGHPKALAWHPDMDGDWESLEPITCYACTSAEEPHKDGTTTPVTFPVIVMKDRDFSLRPLPPMPDPGRPPLRIDT